MSYINENLFSIWIIEKLDGLTTLGLQKLSETVRDYAYNINESNQYERGSIDGHAARNLDAQQVLLNTLENSINRRVDIPEDIQRFEETLQYARRKADCAIGEFIYGLEELNTTITKYWYHHLSFNIRTNLKVNIDDGKHIEKDEPDVKHNIESKKEDKQGIKMINTKPDIKSKKENKQYIKITKLYLISSPEKKTNEILK